jgi:hypothetical protein
MTGVAPFWTVPVKIGGQSFELALDTGSTTTCVGASSCTTCAGTGLYKPGPGAVDEHTPASSVYDSGEISWSGEVFEDAVGVGGAPAVRVKFGAISTQQNFIMGKDGILGFGPTMLEVPGTTSAVDALVHAGMPDVFAVKLCPDDAHLWLGGFDPAAATGPVQYAPLVAATKSMPWYDVLVSGIEIGGAPLDVPAATWGPALVDTGGPSFIVPQIVFTAFTNALAANAAFTSHFGDAPTFFQSYSQCKPSSATPAELDAALPPFTLQLGPADAPVRLVLPATRSYLVPATFYGSAAGSWCPGVVGLAGMKTFDIGDAILRSSIVVFDRAGKRLGFAPHAGCAP